MSIIERMLKQQAVYWPPAATDAHGQITWGSPIQLKCRWEDSTEMVKTAENEIKETCARVYVSQDVEIKGMLMLGVLSSSLDPDPRNNGAHSIEKFDGLPNIKNTKVLRTALLSWGK